MKDLERKIEEAAIKLSSGRNYRDLQLGFITGAKSKEAKEYHTQGMYSEEEVLSLMIKSHFSEINIYEFFKQNKKK